MGSSASIPARWECAILAAILFLGALLRFLYLGAPSFWLDEVIQARTALQPTLTDSLAAIPFNKPPLFYIIEFCLARISATEWMLRLPACLAGIVTIWVFWRLARSLFEDAAMALLAAAFLAISPLHIAYSQEARAYSLSLLFALLGAQGMFALFRRPTRSQAAWTTLWLALSAWTLFFGFGLILLQMSWVLGTLLFFSSRQRRIANETLLRGARAFLWSLLAALLLMLPLLLHVTHKTPETQGLPAPPINLSLLVNVASWLAFATEEKTIGWLLPFFGAALLAGIWVGFRRNAFASIFLLLWLFVLQGAQIVSYILNDHWLAARYHLIFMPPFLLFAAAGMVHLLRRAIPNRRAFCFAAASLILLLAVAGQPFLRARRMWKPDMRSAIRRIAAQADARDVVICSGASIVYVYSYYRDLYKPAAPAACRLNDSLPVLLANLEKKRNLWLLAHDTYDNRNNAFFRRLVPTAPDPFPAQPVIACRPARESMGALLAIPRYQNEWNAMRVNLPLSFQMGDSRAETYMSTGWCGTEKWNNRKVRWIDGLEGQLYFRCEQRLPTTLTLAVKPFLKKGSPPQRLQVFWNETPLGAYVLKRKDFQTLRIALPPQASAPRPWHSLRLRCSQSRRTLKADMTKDKRDCSLAVHTVTLE